MKLTLPTQLVLKCPYCGWSAKLDVASLDRMATTDITKGLGDSLLNVLNGIRQILKEDVSSSQSTWVDVPKCPNCTGSFQINIVSGEIRK